MQDVSTPEVNAPSAVEKTPVDTEMLKDALLFVGKAMEPVDERTALVEAGVSVQDWVLVVPV